jgi:hypothetical protein
MIANPFSTLLAYQVSNHNTYVVKAKLPYFSTSHEHCITNNVKRNNDFSLN